MRRRYKLLLGFFLTAVLLAQSPLVELSKKEKERRKKVKKNTKVITNETLLQLNVYSSSLEVRGGLKEEVSGSGKTEKKSTQKEDKYKDPKYWKNLKLKIETEIRELEAKIKKLRDDVNFLSNQFLLEDRPIERGQVKSRLEEARGLLNQALKQLESKKKELENLYREARKKGVPPGWLR